MSNIESVGDAVRRLENEYIRGGTKISKYVTHSLYETVERITAYINSKHTSGEKDSQGKDKPFPNIVNSASNVYFRATDIDVAHINVTANKAKDWIDAFLATSVLQDFMKREKFGVYLNNWGRVLSRYGSAITKVVENSSGLHLSVVPWNRIIVDPVKFGPNPKIEILELTEAQLKERVRTHNYDEEQVEALIHSFKARETIGRQKKDNRNKFIKLYEVHANFSLSLVTDKDEDKDVFSWQMHVISYVASRKGNKTINEDFSLFKGIEERDPYRIAHLIEEDDRTLSIGAVENLFTTQWMMSHSMKQIKDHLDLAMKLMFQTEDARFLGMNAISAIETGDILVHSIGQPITQLNNSSHDVTQMQNFGTGWKSLGNELVGISESMLGESPKSGTAWRQTEAVLEESRSLFQLMTENKGLFLIDLFREDIIPYLKETKLDNSDEISNILEMNDLNRIDRIYLKDQSTKIANKEVIDRVLRREKPTEEDRASITQQAESGLKEGLSNLGNQRFFKPSDVSDKTWEKQLENIEWDLDIIITGEQKNIQKDLTTLSTALGVIMNPNFPNNPQAQLVVGKILQMTSAISPLELASIPSPVQPSNVPQVDGASQGLETLTEQ